MAEYYSLEILGIKSSITDISFKTCQKSTLSLRFKCYYIMFYFPTCQNDTISGEDENANRLKQKFLKEQLMK